MPHIKQISVEDKIQQIETALKQGHLVNNRLQIVKKHGIKWVWIRFTQCLVKLFSSCTRQKPWNVYQADSVMSALKVYTKDKATPELQERLQRIEDILSKRKINPTAAVTPVSVPYIAPIKPEMEIALANFANDLCSIIVNENPTKSVSVSPVSIVAALGMFLHAIEEGVKPLFLEKIGLKGISEAEAHELIANSLKRMAFPDDFKKGALEIAQGIAHKNHISPAVSLMQLAQNTYGAELIRSDNLQEEVNKWVAKKTHDKIPTILNDNLSNIVLLNAIYLAFQWKDKFKTPKEGWKVDQFTCLDGNSAPVSMMTQTEKFDFYKAQDFKMLEKPYISPEGRKLTQLIFLPNDPAKLNDLEQQLSFEKIIDCRAHARNQEIRLSMPKIKAESELVLTTVLKALGLPIDCVDKIKLGSAGDIEVIHKTFVLNDEKGSEAAAVTAVYAKECASIPKEFNINHAYAYFIMDGNTVLFRGRVVDKTPLVVDQQ